MKHKMSGFIEPFTLGFLISLIATGAIFISEHQSEKSEHEEAAARTETTTSTDSLAENSTNSALGETANADQVGAAVVGRE